MSNWEAYSLSDLVDSISNTFKFGKEKVFFLNTSDTLEGKVINHQTFSPSELPGQAKKMIRKNDILYSEIRPANRRYAYIDFNAENYVASTKLMVLRAKEKILPRFLYYYLTSSEIVNHLQMLAESRSGTFPQIRFEEIKSLNINLPPKSIQEEIVEIIKSLDDKIELNNAINKNLEDLAQTLFKHWFVDFEFPDENGDPYKSSGGEMVESELGMIPKGWKIFSIGDVVDTVSKTYPLREANEVIFLNTGDILDGKFLHNNKSLSSLLPGQAKKSIQKNDILYSEIRPANKRFAFVFFSPEEYVVSTKLMVLRAKVDINPLFPYFVLTQPTTLDYLQRLAESRSGTFPQITFTELSTVKFAAKDLDFVNDFTKRVLVLRYELLFWTESENGSLIQLRDALLPKLISGELEVNETLSQNEKAM